MRSAHSSPTNYPATAGPRLGGGKLFTNIQIKKNFMVITLTNENFKNEVLDEKKPTLVDFYATWCPPCQALHPIFDALEKKYGEKIKFGRLNVGEAEAVASQYGVMSVPTLIFFKEGKEVKKIAGLLSQNALEKILDIF